MAHAKDKHHEEHENEEEQQQKWFVKEDLQDLAKMGGEFLKKKVATGLDVIKDVKEHFPKEASQILNKGKEEILKGLSQETAKTLIGFAVERAFKIASDYRLEFSIRIRRNDDGVSTKTGKHKKEEK